MKKLIATIAYYGCFIISLIVTYSALNSAGELAYSGKQPSVWPSVLGFVAVIALVLAAIYIKVKFLK